MLFLALYCTVLFLVLHCVCSIRLFPTVLPLPSITVEIWFFVTSKKTETGKLIGLPLLQTPVLAPTSVSVTSDQILVKVSGKFSQRTSVLCFFWFFFIFPELSIAFLHTQTHQESKPPILLCLGSFEVALSFLLCSSLFKSFSVHNTLNIPHL